MTTTATKERKAFNPHEPIKSGPMLKSWRRQLKINRDLYADLSDCSVRTLATIEKKNQLALNKERKLNETRRLIEALCDIIEPMHIAAWIEQPNDWLAGNSPHQAIKDGKIDKVWELIYHTRNGGLL